MSSLLYDPSQFQHGPCPFCQINGDCVIQSYDHFFVTLARAPYTTDHILIIPHRHVILFGELSHPETQELFEIIQQRNKTLHQHHDDVVLLFRDGRIGGKAEKSINHLHVHLVPDTNIGARGVPTNRPMHTEDELIQQVLTVKAKYDLSDHHSV